MVKTISAFSEIKSTTLTFSESELQEKNKNTNKR